MSQEQETQTESQNLGLIARILNVFVSPSKTFHSLSAKADWVTPLLVSLVVVGVASLALNDIAIDQQIAKMKKNPNLSEQQLENALEQLASAKKAPMKYLNTGFGVAGGAAIFFLVGLVFWGLGNLILGEKQAYLKVLSAYGYAALISVPETIVKLPLMVSRHTMDVQAGLALGFARNDTSPWLYSLVSKVDIFTIWQLVVLSIGMAVLYRSKTGTAAALVFTVWGIYVALSVGLSQLFGGMFGV